MTRVAAVIIACALTLLASAALAAPPAEWKFQRLPQAMEEAAKSKKLVFALFGFETCGGCKRLYRDTLSDEDLRKAFQEKFVLAYVDTEGAGEPDSYSIGNDLLNHAEVVSRYKGYPTPSWNFLTPKGERLHGGRGGRTLARELMRDAEVALEKLKAGG